MDPTKQQTAAVFAHLKAQKPNKVGAAAAPGLTDDMRRCHPVEPTMCPYGLKLNGAGMLSRVLLRRGPVDS